MDKLHLHARRLIFKHPFTQKMVNVVAPLPPHMLETWKILGLNANFKEKLADDVLNKQGESADQSKVRDCVGNSTNHSFLSRRKSEHQNRTEKRKTSENQFGILKLANIHRHCLRKRRDDPLAVLVRHEERRMKKAAPERHLQGLNKRITDTELHAALDQSARWPQR